MNSEKRSSLGIKLRNDHLIIGAEWTQEWTIIPRESKSEKKTQERMLENIRGSKEESVQRRG